MLSEKNTEGKYYIYNYTDASTLEHDTIVYSYNSFGITAQIGNFHKAMFRCMKANGVGQVQVGEKSKLFIKTNFQKKMGCMEKVLRSTTLVDKVMELLKHPNGKK